MAKQTINVGINANDSRGDPLRTAFTKINENFDEVYDIIPTDISELTDTEGLLGQGSANAGIITTDINGSVFANDNTLLVDSVNAKIVGNVETESLRTSETKIALGRDAGKTSQGQNTVAVGSLAGETSQGDFAVAIGREAGETSQGQNAVAVGRRAGETSQGENAIAIGFRAGETQANNSIVINATGNLLNNTVENTFVVKPIRDAVGTTMLMYNANTGEVTHAPSITSVSSIANGNTKIEIPDEDGDIDINGNIVLFGGLEINRFGGEAGDNNLVFLNSGNEQGRITAQGETGGAIQIQANPLFEIKVSQDDGSGGTETALWVFESDGGVEFPDSTTQTTAFTTSPTLDILKIDVGTQEKYQIINGATETVTHDCSLGHIFYHINPTSNWTVNLTNLNLEIGYATAITLIIEQGSTGFYPSALTIAGSAQGTITIRWQGGVIPTPSTDAVDVVTFSIINDSNLYTALGQLTGF
jgi:hypothetical protein